MGIRSLSATGSSDLAVQMAATGNEGLEVILRTNGAKYLTGLYLKICRETRLSLSAFGPTVPTVNTQGGLQEGAGRIE